MKLENNNKEEFDINQVKVDRTREGTIMEVLAILLLAVTWAIGLTKQPSLVPQVGIYWRSASSFPLSWSCFSLRAISQDSFQIHISFATCARFF